MQTIKIKYDITIINTHLASLGLGRLVEGREVTHNFLYPSGENLRVISADTWKARNRIDHWKDNVEQNKLGHSELKL